MLANSLRLKDFKKIFIFKNNVPILWNLTYFAIKIASRYLSPESYQTQANIFGGQLEFSIFNTNYVE